MTEPAQSAILRSRGPGRASTNRDNLLRSLPHVVLCLVLATLLGLAELNSKLFERLLQEDGWAEWATFATFGAAFVIGLTAARDRARAKLERAALVALALFCLFVAGEEISWGQRLVGYRPPVFFLERNFQQEANLHNLLKEVLDTRFMVMAIALLYGVLGPFLCFVTRLPRLFAPALPLLPYFAVVAWLSFSYPYELVGELSELLLGLLFLVDMVQRTSVEPLTFARRATFAQVAALTSAALLVPLHDGLMRLHAGSFSVAARAELSHLAGRIGAGATLQPALFDKKHIHKRLYTAARAGYLELPPDEYALDPWNNPYWLAFQRGSDGQGKVLIYSFGANHRRESDVDHFTDGSFALQGDDLGLLLDVHAPAQAAR